MKQIVLWACMAMMACTACEDWRRDQREDNLFDPSNAFIRFDFGNAVNSIARDSVLLRRSVLDSVLIPVALSAPPQQGEVRVRVEAKLLSGNMQQGTHFDLLLGGAPLSADQTIRMMPGQFVQVLTYKERALPPAGPHRLRLELTEVTPASIHLGFPGSGRGRQFDLLYNE